jgi:hypothetical protein
MQEKREMLVVLSAELKQQIEREAATNFRSQNGQVNFILKSHFDRERQKAQVTVDA